MDEKYILAHNKYGQYFVPKSSAYTFTAKAILSGKVHEPSTIRFMAEHNENCDIIHAGAGFGDFLPALSKSTAGHVWTFEPNDENFYCAKKTIEINSLNNVKLFHCGLASTRASKHFRTRENGLDLGPRTRTTEIIDPEDGLQKCEVYTLDELVDSPRVSILHLDVEGYEFEILKGAANLIEKHSPLIILEIDANALVYNDFMQSLGYKPARQLVYNAKEMVFVNTVYTRRK